MGGIYLYENYQEISLKILAGIGFALLIAVGIRVIYGRWWWFNLGKQIVIGNDLILAIENYLKALPFPGAAEKANLLGHLIYRFTRIGVFAIIITIVPIVLLNQQNRLIKIQNELVAFQNSRINYQTYLQEAERRSSLVFLFSNVMDAIDRELREDVYEDNLRNLSPQLIGRIISLSQRLKPYQYLDADTLISRPLSPERGQLLVNLVESKLDIKTYEQIWQKADFSYSDLQAIKFDSTTYLQYANLNRSNFTDAEFFKVNLRSSNLEHSILNTANFSGTDLSYSSLIGVQMDPVSFIGGAKLKEESGHLYTEYTRETYRDDNVLIPFLQETLVDSNFINNLGEIRVGWCNYCAYEFEQVMDARELGIIPNEFILKYIHHGNIEYKQWSQ
ncbi:MAG: pentapeptide repeat-containing protein [Cyanobacteria bacterium J06649_11]